MSKRAAVSNQGKLKTPVLTCGTSETQQCQNQLAQLRVPDTAGTGAGTWGYLVAKHCGQ